MTLKTNAVERALEAQVKQIFVDAGWGDYLPMSIKACETGGTVWRRGMPTGMFSVDVWGARMPVSRNREHMFRTKKDGSFSAETLTKIKEFAVRRIAIEVSQKAAEKARNVAINANAGVAEHLRRYAKEMTGSYYSDSVSQYGGYITEDSGVSGKVKVNVGNQILTSDQARKLFDLLATFK